MSGRLDRVPRNREVAVVCGSGYRASIGASLLKRAGYSSVTNVLGGMAAWKATSLSTSAERTDSAAAGRCGASSQWRSS